MAREDGLAGAADAVADPSSILADCHASSSAWWSVPSRSWTMPRTLRSGCVESAVRPSGASTQRRRPSGVPSAAGTPPSKSPAPQTVPDIGADVRRRGDEVVRGLKVGQAVEAHVDGDASVVQAGCTSCWPPRPRRAPCSVRRSRGCRRAPRSSVRRSRGLRRAQRSCRRRVTGRRPAASRSRHPGRRGAPCRSAGQVSRSRPGRLPSRHGRESSHERQAHRVESAMHGS